MALIGRRKGKRWVVICNHMEVAEYQTQAEQWYHISTGQRPRSPLVARAAMSAAASRIKRQVLSSV